MQELAKRMPSQLSVTTLVASRAGHGSGAQKGVAPASMLSLWHTIVVALPV
jgi:hypothetical protein